MAAPEESKLAKVENADEVVDEKLVADAAKHIKKTLEETVIRGTVEVGSYLFEKFFDNDVERVRSHNPQKNASFRTLAEKCGTPELPVSKTWLSNAVGVAVICKVLPDSAAYKQLPPSHQTVLLPLREPKLVEAMAERVVKQELTVSKLRPLVQQKVAANKEEGRGRPPTPVIVKTLNRTLKLFTLESGRKSFTKRQVSELSEDDAKKARKTAEALVESLKKLLAELPKK
jgi:hypothetical protein